MNDSTMAPPPLPTIRPETTKEHHRAKWWRTNVMHMDVATLAKATGYTDTAIYLFEAGTTSTGQPIKPWVWKRWKMICAGVHAEYHGWRSGCQFDWIARP